MALTRAEAEGILKEFYLPVAREQLNTQTVLLDRIDQNSDNVEGLEVVLSLHVRRNPGKGARLDNEDLPTAGNQKHIKSRVGMRYNYLRGQVTGPTLAAAKTDRGSFLRPMENEMSGAVTNSREDINRQLFGTSDGVISALADTGSSTTVTLLASQTVEARQVKIRQIHEGDRVDIGQNDGTLAGAQATASDREVLSVDPDAFTFVISGAAIDVAAGDCVFIHGSAGSPVGDEQRELTGLQSIVSDTGELFGVDPATWSMWKSTVSENGGTLRSTTEGLVQSTIQRKTNVSDSKTVNLALSSYGVMQNYYNQLASRRQIVDKVDIGGGYQGLFIDTLFGRVPFTHDKDCPANSMFLLDTAHLTINQSSDWEMMGEDGSKLSRVPNRDAYEFTLFKYAELTTDMRNAHAVIRDLQEDSE